VERRHREGRFLALRAQWKAAIGAYFSTDRPTIPLTIGLGCLVNTYGVPAVHAQVIAVLTNTMSIAPYRGGSRPEPIYVIETIIDKAARELGIDPAELRRRNTIPVEAMPFTTVLQQTYDSGDFVKNSIVGGQRLGWEEKDVFTVPTWTFCEHVNSGDRPAFLFSFSDAPVMKGLSLYRDETRA
jgi:carbon-monoxide dehydrogenase large subunit